MTLSSIITPMQSIIIKDCIAEILAQERDNQIKIAEAEGYDDKWIEQNINFTVFNKRFTQPDAEDCPCVFIYIDNVDFDSSRQYTNSYFSSATLNCEMYAVGTDEEDSVEKKVIKTADANADERLGYLLSQVFKTLSAEENWDKGTDGIISEHAAQGYQRIAQPDTKTHCETILGWKLSYLIGFEELTQQISGKELKELYIRLQIRDELIDPFIKILFEN